MSVHLLSKIHPEILYRHPKKAETFSLVLACMFVVLLMCPPYSQEIRVLSIPEQWYSLVYEDIVYKKIGHTIQAYAQPYKEYVIIMQHCPTVHKQNSGNCEYDKKIIIAF